MIITFTHPFESLRKTMYGMSLPPEWWNWQTRGTQNPVASRPCGFDPRLRHQQNQQVRREAAPSGLLFYFHTHFSPSSLHLLCCGAPVTGKTAARALLYTSLQEAIQKLPCGLASHGSFLGIFFFTGARISARVQVWRKICAEKRSEALLLQAFR